MSVRAYRINKIEREQNPTFNLWHDTKFWDFVLEHNETDIESGLSENGGQVAIDVAVLEKAVEEFDFTNEADLEQVKSDIAFANENEDSQVLYDCF